MKPDTNNSEQPEQLLLEMQGLSDDNGQVPAGLFLLAFGALRGLMGKILERRLEEKKNQKAWLFIAELSHSRLVRGGIGVVSREVNGLASAVMTEAESVFLRIQDGKGDDTPESELHFLEQIIAGRKKNQVSATKIQRLNGRATPYSTVEITPEFIHNVERIRKAEIRGITTVVGDVTALDLHLTPHNPFYRLQVHPGIGPPVKFRLPPEEREDAIRAIGKRAAITGEARYRPDFARPLVQHPYRIDEVSNLEIFDTGPTSPKLSDFRGAFPDLTGGKDTLEYLRELRGED